MNENLEKTEIKLTSMQSPRLTKTQEKLINLKIFKAQISPKQSYMNLLTQSINVYFHIKMSISQMYTRIFLKHPHTTL